MPRQDYDNGKARRNLPNSVDVAPSVARYGITREDAVQVVRSSEVQVPAPGGDDHADATLIPGYPNPQTGSWWDFIAEIRPHEGC